MRIVAFTALVVALAAADARALDEALYATVLEQHTRAVDDIASTRVDYGALRSSKAWETLLGTVRESDPSRLRSKNEKLAFWINIYNILAIDLVRRHYPVDSIRSIGGFFSPVWKMIAGEVGGRSYTLHQIEHEILRPMGEPRIHAAIVCAALSCPPLRREPYRTAELDAQLDDNVRLWFADPRKGARIDRLARTLYLSPILDWFAEDFGNNVLLFAATHLSDEDASWIRAQGNALRIRYLDYDWRLNDKVRDSRLSLEGGRCPSSFHSMRRASLCTSLASMWWTGQYTAERANFPSAFSGPSAELRAGHNFGPSNSKTVLSGWKIIHANQNPSTTSIPSEISKSKCLVFGS